MCGDCVVWWMLLDKCLIGYGCFWSMLDPSLQFINRVILFQLFHLSSFLYLFPLSYFCSFLHSWYGFLSNDGTWSMTLCQSSVARTKRLLEKKQAARMRLMSSSLLIKSSTTTTRRDSLLNTLGRNCATTRSGASLLLLKPKGAWRRGSVRTMLIPHALKQLAPSVPRVWRPQSWVLRSRW